MADFGAYIQKDEWTPTMEIIEGKLNGFSLKRFWGDIGKRIVAVLKTRMQDSIGFSDHQRYKKLKIDYRYHGHKSLVASPKNLSRKARGAKPKGGEIEIVSKTAVTSETKPLIDTGRLKRSWAVKDYNSNSVKIGNKWPAEKLKAVYNDDRGHWEWKRKSAREAFEMFLGYLDKDLF